MTPTMLVKEAKAIAHQWAVAEGSKTAGFAGAYLAGSTTWLDENAAFPATSDVDVWVVLAGPEPQNKLGKFSYQDVLLEVSYQSLDQLQSPEQVLADYHMAGSFRQNNILLDPSRQLTQLQSVVAQNFAKRTWVERRCQDARNRVLRNLQSLDAVDPFHDQVMVWLFANGVMTHVLLVAGLRNPTVRQRYVAVKALLAEYGRLDEYERLLELLGCAHFTQSQVEKYLTRLHALFDAAASVIKTPFFFAADISEFARPVAIDGSRELIERGDYREAVFWIVATYSRCHKILHHDAPLAIQARFEPGYRHLLGDLGITSFVDLQQRGERVKQHLPDLWRVTEAILAANPEIDQDDRLTWLNSTAVPD
jgi:hypothetical protein